MPFNLSLLVSKTILVERGAQMSDPPTLQSLNNGQRRVDAFVHRHYSPGPQMSFDKGRNDENIEISWAFGCNPLSSVPDTLVLSACIWDLAVSSYAPRKSSCTKLLPDMARLWASALPRCSTVLGAFGNVTRPVL
ncbi:hypothetical protein BDZ97DRAFT_1765795 [Flammula alnicola]|nr:hypothetical protein BDZ97DRAFT_1772011 [Flammula alnicola]KAF8954778.1 hypothetical protein BDZ97DRAFT_1765795 [Flammula alnicola]